MATTQIIPETSTAASAVLMPNSVAADTTITPPSTSVFTSAGDDNDPFFAESPKVLFQTDRLVEFFPTADMTLPERMNAVTRMVIYIALALAYYKTDIVPLHFGALVVGILYGMWHLQTVYIPPRKAATEHFNVIKTPCTLPTKENPFMNLMMFDEPNRPPACAGPGIEEMAENLLNSQLKENPEDLFGKAANQRQFYTMPSTRHPNDRERYMNWLFKDEVNCRAGGVCVPFSDLRYERRGPANDPLMGALDLTTDM